MGISVIIPAFNAEQTIKRCLDSIIKQNDSLIEEIIVVDDGSEDNTTGIVKQYSKINQKIKLISQKNKGVSSARNTGLMAAVGEYVIFCDSDDELTEDCCECLLNAIEWHSCDMAICGYREIHQSSSINRIPPEELCGKAIRIQDGFEMLFYGFFLNTPWGRIYRRNKIVALFDENLSNGEDIKFVLDYLRENPMCIAVNRQLYLIHTENENSLSRRRINALECTVKTQMNIGDFLSKTKSKINWTRFSDYCLSLVWSNIVDGRNLGQFSCREGYQSLELSPRYYDFVKELRPGKAVNKITKMAIAFTNKEFAICVFELLSWIKRISKHI